MPKPNYYQLNPDKVHDTIVALTQRIEERFPGAGLVNVSRTLESASATARERAIWIERPIWPLRIGSWLLIALTVAALLFPFFALDTPEGGLTLIDFVTVMEAAINDLIFLSVGAFFLLTLESRIKRRRGLRALHELRSLAHVIDMHQLTKDPERVLSTRTDTSSSPQIQLTPFLLRRYLDYSSELLSLTAKIASVYLNRLDDPTVIATVNEIEQLTNGISRKIWQKIAATQQLHGASSLDDE